VHDAWTEGLAFKEMRRQHQQLAERRRGLEERKQALKKQKPMGKTVSEGFARPAPPKDNKARLTEEEVCTLVYVFAYVLVCLPACLPTRWLLCLPAYPLLCLRADWLAVASAT